MRPGGGVQLPGVSPHGNPWRLSTLSWGRALQRRGGGGPQSGEGERSWDTLGEAAEYLARAQPFEAPQHTSREPGHRQDLCGRPGSGAKVRDTSRRADASAMRSPSGKAVSVRLFSQVVVAQPPP